MTEIETLSNIHPSDVARYFLQRTFDDGELISPLKMQKLVYYAYAWTLVKNHKRLFSEKIQAWPNGPVAPSLYKELKIYGSMPISEEYLNGSNDVSKNIPDEVIHTLDEVYEKYSVCSAFELVCLTHNEKPWRNARQGLKVNESSEIEIRDKDIIEEYSLT